MKRFAIIFCVVLWATQNLLAQDFFYHNGTMRMPFREMKFGNGTERPALIVYLHPREARGSDNQKQTEGKAFQQIQNYLENAGQNAILLAPQCELSRHWNEYSSPLGKYLSNVVKDLIDDYVSKHEIDTHRIYILGVSFGGSGVWRLITDYPNYFAAAIPAVSHPKMNRLEKYVKLNKAAKTPICMVVGEKDTVYGPSVVDQYADKLRKQKCNLKYVLLHEMTHYQACDNAFPVEALDWLFQQKR